MNKNAAKSLPSNAARQGAGARPSLADGTTVAEFSKALLEYSRVNNKPSETESKTIHLARHILPVFGATTLDGVRFEDIESFKKNKLDCGLSAKTINNILITLNKLLTLARDFGALESPPKVKLLKSRAPAMTYLTFREADALCAASPPGYWRTMFLLALKTGMRAGEVLGLKRGSVDFARSSVTVSESYTRGEQGSPKSNRSRVVPMTKTLAQAMRDQLESHQDELVFPLQGSGVNTASDRLNYGHILAPLRRACRNAKMRPVGWHTLRHTFASHLAIKGVPMLVIKELMGHSTVTMTERYAHLSDSAKSSAIDLLDV